MTHEGTSVSRVLETRTESMESMLTSGFSGVNRTTRPTVGSVRVTMVASLEPELRLLQRLFFLHVTSWKGPSVSSISESDRLTASSCAVGSGVSSMAVGGAVVVSIPRRFKNRIEGSEGPGGDYRDLPMTL